MQANDFKRGLLLATINHKDHERFKSERNGDAGAGCSGTFISIDPDRKTKLKITNLN